MKKSPIQRVAETYLTPKLRWNVGEVDQALRFVGTGSTNEPEKVEAWRPATAGRLALDLEKSRLVAISFATPDDRKRLEATLGYSLEQSRMSDQTVVLKLPGNLTETPKFSLIAPGAWIQGAWSPLVIPDSALEWLSDPRSLDHVPLAGPSLLKLVHRRDWTVDKWKRLG
jgi:hypothetical protein